jgi:hypothetical protein
MANLIELRIDGSKIAERQQIWVPRCSASCATHHQISIIWLDSCFPVLILLIKTISCGYIYDLHMFKLTDWSKSSNVSDCEHSRYHFHIWLTYEHRHLCYLWKVFSTNSSLYTSVQYPGVRLLWPEYIHFRIIVQYRMWPLRGPEPSVPTSLRSQLLKEVQDRWSERHNNSVAVHSHSLLL